jgi:CRISPR type III-A-associated RAMP protein Csm4
MQPAVLIRLRPLGPWRYGAGEGGNDRVDKVFRSDRLYSAVTLALQQFGLLEEWLDATARASGAQVAFSSLFPYQGDTLFAPPPRTIWPPPSSLVTAPSPVFLSKIRWDAAQFVPTTVIDSMLTGRPILAEQWAADPESGCLLRRDRPSTSPFRAVMRTRAAIDRLSQTAAQIDSFACVEFEPGAGLWCLARFQDAEAEGRWSDRLKAAFRLLADTGFGGGRTSGWGQTAEPEFQNGSWPNLLLPRSAKASASNSANGENAAYWLLSLYSPAQSDSPDWTGGDYELVTRGGYVHDRSAKKTIRMIGEGSVLVASQEPSGVAVDVAPDGFEHPVYRAGFALALRLPELTEEDIKPVEEPTDEEALEIKPCAEPAVPEIPTLEEPEPTPETSGDVSSTEPAQAEPPEEPHDEL